MHSKTLGFVIYVVILAIFWGLACMWLWSDIAIGQVKELFSREKRRSC